MIKVTDVSKLKVGGYIIEDDEAFKIMSIAHSKAGKHGSAKIRMEIASVIGNKKASIVKAGGTKVSVPIIEKHTAQILTINEIPENTGYETIIKKVANVMDMDSYETFDMEVPDELKNDIKEGVKVIYWDVMGIKQMKQVTN